jgi:hypothetical protein
MPTVSGHPQGPHLGQAGADARGRGHRLRLEGAGPDQCRHPPKKTERAVRVHGLFTLLMCAPATAYRLQCEREGRGGAPVGRQRWRRQPLEEARDRVIVFAQGGYDIFHLAEYSLLAGVKLKDVPPGIGTHQDVLAKHRLTKRSQLLCRNLSVTALSTC